MNEPASGGLLGSLKGLLDAVLETVQNRVELFGVELKEQQCRLIETIVLAAVVVALGVVTVILLTLSIIVLLWEEARLSALIVLGFLYLLATFIAYRRLDAKLKNQTVFSDTLNEIKKDRECLDSKK